MIEPEFTFNSYYFPLNKEDINKYMGYNLTIMSDTPDSTNNPFSNQISGERTPSARFFNMLISYDLYVEPLELSHGSRILEVGAGTGNRMNSIGWVGGYQMFGVDLDFAAMAAGRDANPALNLSVAGGELLPFARGSFDAIISIGLLGEVHPDELQKVFGEFRRVGRGGRMIHQVPVQEDMNMSDKEDMDQTLHTAMWWVKLFNNNGYRVISNPTKHYLDRWGFLPMTRTMHGYFVVEPL